MDVVLDVFTPRNHLNVARHPDPALARVDEPPDAGPQLRLGLHHMPVHPELHSSRTLARWFQQVKQYGSVAAENVAREAQAVNKRDRERNVKGDVFRRIRHAVVGGCVGGAGGRREVQYQGPPRTELELQIAQL